MKKLQRFISEIVYRVRYWLAPRKKKLALAAARAALARGIGEAGRSGMRAVDSPEELRRAMREFADSFREEE